MPYAYGAAQIVPKMREGMVPMRDQEVVKRLVVSSLAQSQRPAGRTAAPRGYQRTESDPEGYLMAARRLGVAPADCVVVEDSPPGVAAGRAAGMRVIAVLTTYPAAALSAADARLASLADLRIQVLASPSTGLRLDF